MAIDDFQARLNRIDEKRTAISGQASVLDAAKGSPENPPFKSEVFGALCSVVVLVLFNNLQTISDMAPESIKQSSAPGALGLPIALLTIVWFTVIPLRLVRHVLSNARLGNGPSLPSPFVSGAFGALALGFAVMQLMGMEG